MKKLPKLSKLLLIPLAGFFAFVDNLPAYTVGPPIDYYYVTFTISEGIENAHSSVLTEGIVAKPIIPDDYIRTIPIGTTQAEVSSPIYLIYQSAPGYQNAQCLVDGIPKPAIEYFNFYGTKSNPTQIVCTAELIPEPEPEEPEAPAEPESTSSSVDFNLNISEMLEIIGLPSTIKLDIDSSNFGALATTTLNLFTSSNYAYGYNFTLLTDSTNLTDSTTSAAIPTLASGTYTDANFTTNRWGLSLDSTNFRPISTTNSLNSTTAPATRIPTTITLGVKLDATQPAGAYSTVLNFALTPNIVTE